MSSRLAALVLVVPTGLASDARSQHAPEQRASRQGSAPPVRTSAQAELDRLDTRSPVPLLPMMAQHQKQNMREHLSAVQAIIAAAASGDFASIEKAAGSIGYSEQMGQMCKHMGAGAPGFTDRALAFHHSADTIGDAARAHDMSGVLIALSTTLGTCTGCHASFKQELVAELPSPLDGLPKHGPASQTDH